MKEHTERKQTNKQKKNSTSIRDERDDRKNQAKKKIGRGKTII